MKKILFILSIALLTTASFGQANPAKRTYLIQNVTIHVGNGTVIENGALATDNTGKIKFVGKMSDADKSNYDTVINAEGKHVYPGMIAVNTSIGLVEIEAVRATIDTREVGQLNPNVRSVIAYNTDSKVIPTVRF